MTTENSDAPVMIISADGHPAPAEILTPPTEDLFPRGDVHKPLGLGVG
jgi:hypothetical protein